jgi:hypothetical protein
VLARDGLEGVRHPLSEIVRSIPTNSILFAILLLFLLVNYLTFVHLSPVG